MESVSALIELNFEDKLGKTICYDIPVSLEVFAIAYFLQLICQNNNNNNK